MMWSVYLLFKGTLCKNSYRISGHSVELTDAEMENGVAESSHVAQARLVALLTQKTKIYLILPLVCVLMGNTSSTGL